MKRLKNILLSLQPNDTTYKKMYEGKLHMLAEPDSKSPSVNVSEPIYWNNQISYKIERTNRLEAGKPTITIGIPIKRLHIIDGLVDGSTYISQRGIPAADYCLRAFKKYLDELNEKITNKKRTDKENGRYYIYEPNGKVLKRNCSYFQPACPKYYKNTGHLSGATVESNSFVWYLNIMIMVQLPEKKIKQTIQMLTKDLPNAVEHFIRDFNVSEMKKAILLYNKQQEIRRWLKNSQYCSFIADGSILPREQDTDFPMKKAKPFSSVQGERIQIGELTGMGIRKGVTVITGGGYSGKSTLLDAIAEGIYNHIAGDGREYVITEETAMNISAEDGRSIRNVDISAFIQWIPGTDTKNFSTDHASGSTSQAANIVEAVNDGSKLLLIDEDKSATNFMIRDEMMKHLIQNDPIIPFTDRVRELFHQENVSTILVIGGSSEYLRVSDHVIMMKNYMPRDITRDVRTLLGKKEKERLSTYTWPPMQWNHNKKIATKRFTTYSKESLIEHFLVSDKGFIELGDECIDIRRLDNLVDLSQLTTIGFLIRKIALGITEQQLDINQAVEASLRALEEGNLDDLYSTFFTDSTRWLEMPRVNEVLAVVHRMRYI